MLPDSCFNDTSTTEIYTLSLHDALPIWILQFQFYKAACDIAGWRGPLHRCSFYGNREVGRRLNEMLAMGASRPWPEDRKSTRLNSSHANISYAVFCLKKKTTLTATTRHT